MKPIFDDLANNVNNDSVSSSDEMLTIADLVPNINNNILKLIDSDGDGIPDEWELNGYTVENNKIVPWDETKHQLLGLTKYVSDPFNAYSSGGPYSDLEKVLGKVDCLKEAKHPLVATYPVIKIEMEKIILSKNLNVSDQEGKTSSQEKTNTVGLSTNNSHTDSQTVGGSVSVSANFSKQNSKYCDY